MAYSFTPETPVLNFGPRRPKEHSWTSREYVLWPAWSYRVVAPVARERKLNMFQRATLGLCRVGLQDRVQIAEKLAIHADLAGLVIVELTELGYVDRYGVITKSGEQVLVEDSIDAHDLVAGYVFQDPWEGDLWSRFAEQLAYCELEYGSSGFPDLLLGSSGQPRRQGAFMVLPTNTPAPSRPTPAKVVSAVAGHRRGLRYAPGFSADDHDQDEPSFVPGPIHIDRVSFIEEDPAPVFLVTYLYTAGGESDTGDWHACDPFGLGASVGLKRRIERRMQTLPPLYGVVNRLVGRAMEEGLEGHRRWVDQLMAMAELEVESRLTVSARDQVAFGRLVDMESARLEVSHLGLACPQPRMEEALRSCVKCLEALLGDLSEQYPLEDIWKRLFVARVDARTGETTLQPQQDRGLLAAIYQSAVFAVGLDEQVPEPLLNIKPNHIRAVAQYREHWRLRALAMATVLAASKDETHPLRGAARRLPGLLRHVEEIADKGGKFGHASRDRVTLEEVERTVELTYSVTSALIGVGGIVGIEQ